MNELKLTRAEIDALIKQHDCCSDKKQAYRLNAIILLAKGYSFKEVEDALLIDERTARRYKDIFLEKGSAGLLKNNYRGSESYLNQEQLNQLQAHMRQNIYLRAKDIVRFIKNTFHVDYTSAGLVPLLHRLGFVYKKTKQVPGKADANEQEAFVKKYRKICGKMKKNDAIYFTDATHPIYNSIAGYGWIPKGMEAFVKSNTGRQRLNINGAVNPHTGEIIASEYQTVNAEATMDLLDKIRKHHGENGQINVFLDRARYNYSRAVRRHAKKLKINLQYLPAYSPNLNLIERVWHYMKKEVMYNRYYETYADFRAAMLSFLNNRSRAFRTNLLTLLAENFYIYNTV